MIAVNWGTTNFRAYRLDASGSVIEHRASARGILSVEAGGFAKTLLEQTDDWLRAGENRVLLSGMVGSRQGWKETGYIACPAGIDELIDGLVQVEFNGAEVLIVPGMICSDADGVPDVMRGEETEILGVLEQRPEVNAVCLPGTHSKWARVEGGRTCAFATSMTGEIFAALSQHTILARLMIPGHTSTDAFTLGVIRSKESGGLLHHLFGVRSRVLTNCMREEEAWSYLSGLLIGHEIGSMMQQGSQIHLTGALSLCMLYSAAIGLYGGASSIMSEDAAAHGLAAIGRRISWI